MSNLAIHLFLSGDVFFAAILLGCICVGLWRHAKRPVYRSFLTVTAVMSVLLFFLSATPLHWLLFALWPLLFLRACYWAARRPDLSVSQPLAALIILSAFLCIAEGRYHLPVTVPLKNIDTLYVVGDSLSMGADPPGKNWPDLLGEKLGLTTHTFSFGGARTDTALENARRVDKETALVVLEIGGNDLLYGAEGFAPNLETILKTVCNGKRTVVMLELPLPPTFNSFGAAQRTLAQKYGVTLIPKRTLARVITSQDATTDSLHLSNKGHVMLADALSHCFFRSG